MTETGGLQFGPQWLRDTFHEANGTPQGSQAHHASSSHSLNHHSPASGANNGRGAVSFKLADFRYGREEMLALFDEYMLKDRDRMRVGVTLPEDDPLVEMKLWNKMPAPPLNLQDSMSEEEQRAWQKGVNSDTSLRNSRKEMPLESAALARGGGAGAGIRGMRGGGPPGGSLGRGRGFERHRSVNEEEEFLGLGPAARGRGRGYDRSLSDRGGWFDRPGSGSVEDPTLATRKNYSRAPYDDWRKTGDDDNESGGWRSANANNATRRWNTGPTWRERSGGEEAFARGRFNDYVNGAAPPGGNPRWKDPPSAGDGFNRGSRGGRGGHHGSALGQRRFRNESENLPEWASEESGTGKGGTFDASGKFQAMRINGGDSGEDEGPLDWADEDDNVVEVEVDPDDLPDENGREARSSISSASKDATPSDAQEKQSSSDRSTGQGADEEVHSEDIPDLEQQPSPPEAPATQTLPDNHDHRDQASEEPGSHLDAGHLVSKLVDDDDIDHMDLQLQTSKPDRTPQHSPQLHQSHPQHQQQPQHPQFHQQAQGSTYQAPPIEDEGLRPENVQWIYLDPQRQTQGPFATSDMLDWSSLGYFPNDLMIRRTCDHQFLSLKDMTRIFRGNPFSVAIQPGPIDAQKIQEEAMILEHLRRQQEQQLLQQRQQQLLALQQQLHQQQQQSATRMQDPHQVFNNLLFSQNGPNPSIGGGSLLHPEALLRHQHPNTPADMPMDPLKLHMQQQQHQQQQNRAQHGSPERTTGFGQGLSNSSSSHTSFHNQHQVPTSAIASTSPGPDSVQRPPSSSKNDYDAIQSLLSQLQSDKGNQSSFEGHVDHQLQQQQQHDQHQRLTSFGGLNVQRTSSSGDLEGGASEHSIWDVPTSEQYHPETKTSVWEDNNHDNYHQKPEENEDESSEDCAPEEPKPHTKIHSVQQLRSDKVAPPPDIPIENDVSVEDFVKPRSNEKKDKKTRKAEEKRRQKEAKRAAEQAAENRYIPGMQGTVRPDEPMTVAKEQELNEEVKIQQKDALKKLQEEHRERSKMEELQRQEFLAAQQTSNQAKLAPWAKKNQEEAQSKMSLMEIQKLEEKREREQQQLREEQMRAIREQQMRDEEEMRRRQQSNRPSWASIPANGPNFASDHSQNQGPVKSLAEIQEEEARIERERREHQKMERKSRQDMNLATASVWGKAASNLSWASMAGTSGGPAQAPPSQSQASRGHNNNGGGFWEEVPQSTGRSNQKQANQPTTGSQPVNQPQPQQQSKKGGKNKGGKTNSAKGNAFEAWCISALEQFNTNLDIPTFMTFLNDIESPYEVNDYVKSYIGEGKQAKGFAQEYLERRSRHKNALKNNNRAHLEDELLTPATAINPNDDEFIPVGGAGAGAKGRNKKRGKGKGKSTDASHLLGFNVQSNRINAGELDMPK